MQEDLYILIKKYKIIKLINRNQFKITMEHKKIVLFVLISVTLI